MGTWAYKQMKVLGMVLALAAFNLPALEVITANAFHDVTRAPLGITRKAALRRLSLLSVAVASVPQLVISTLATLQSAKISLVQITMISSSAFNVLMTTATAGVAWLWQPETSHRTRRLLSSSYTSHSGD